MNKKYLQTVVLICFLLPIQSFSAEHTVTQDQASYMTSAESGQAEQKAQQNAQQQSDSLTNMLMTVESMEEQYQMMQENGTTQQQAMAENDYHNSEEMYMRGLSSMSGVSMDDLEEMHDNGMSYRDMADELGMPMGNDQMVGSLNSSHSAQQNMQGSQVMSAESMTEMMAATGRNTESGWAEGHGNGMQSSTGTNHSSGSGSMMSGTGGLANDMSGMDDSSHGGMGSSSGGMGASSSGASAGGGVGGSGNSGGMGGSGGGMGGSGGGMGGSGGGGGGGMM